MVDVGRLQEKITHHERLMYECYEKARLAREFHNYDVANRKTEDAINHKNMMEYYQSLLETQPVE